MEYIFGIYLFDVARKKLSGEENLKISIGEAFQAILP
jgi:hypothetical protein